MPSNADTMRRIRALLSKAESTDFVDERDALLDKVSDMMMRHAITEAELDAHTSAAERKGKITQRFMVVPGPYAMGKCAIVSQVGDACRVHVLRVSSRGSYGGPVPKGGYRLILMGFESDLDFVETLSTSLMVQAARELSKAPVPAWDTPKRFRYSFMLGFANHIGNRMQEQMLRTRGDMGGRGIELYDREKLVKEYSMQQFPNQRMATARASSNAGHASGTEAANRADLGNTRVGANQRKELGA